MNWKIVVDSGCDLRELPNLAPNTIFQNVPLSINVGQTEFVDSADLDTAHMMTEMYAYEGKTSSACPSPEAFAKAMTGADNVLVFTLTSALSGSHNSATLARSLVLEEHPNTQIHIMDSRSASGEIALLALKANDLIAENLTFDAVVKNLVHYQQRTHLLFALARVDNLVKNGRLNKLVGTVVGLLNIRLVGQASQEGTLELLHRCRGQKKAVVAIYDEMKKKGYSGGRVILCHCFNPEVCGELAKRVLQEFPEAEITQLPTSGLCSYYAEQGGLLLGFESTN